MRRAMVAGLLGLGTIAGAVQAADEQAREAYFGGLGTLGWLDGERGANQATGLELVYGRRPVTTGWGWEANLFGAIQETGDTRGTDFYRWGLGGDLSYALAPRAGVVPFGLAGVAFNRNDVQPNALDSWDWSAGLGVGAVSQRVFGGMFRLRGEARATYDSYRSGLLDYLLGFGVELKLGGVAPAPMAFAEAVRVVPVAACEVPQPGAMVDHKGCAVEEVTRLDGVTFEFDRARLRPDAQTILADVADTLKRYPALEVEIAGHTDSLGSDDYNRVLSQARADAVRQSLIDHGVDAGRVTAAGYGESQPVADNETEDGRERNRRVEMRIKNLPGSAPAARS